MSSTRCNGTFFDTCLVKPRKGIFCRAPKEARSFAHTLSVSFGICLIIFMISDSSSPTTLHVSKHHWTVSFQRTCFAVVPIHDLHTLSARTFPCPQSTDNTLTTGRLKFSPLSLNFFIASASSFAPFTTSPALRAPRYSRMLLS